MAGTHSLTAPAAAPPQGPRHVTVVPGVALCLAVAIASYTLGLVLPGVSPLLMAIVAGMLLANLTGLPAMTEAGIEFSAKRLLRVGIIFLGLQLGLSDIAALGTPLLAVVVVVVTGGILGTILLGRLLRVPPHLALLIGCGFSICGAAAVAGAAGVTNADQDHEDHRAHEDDTVAAVALVVLFGTLMILLVPLAVRAIGLDPVTAGTWAGASIHEIAQVVAVGGILGGGALTVAVVVKLARVLLLAPVVAVLSLRQRHLRAAERRGDPGASGKVPPVVPPFILGFLAMVLVRTFVPLPPTVLTAGGVAQTVLLGAAMFGLGCGVRIRSLLRVGLRPFVLAGLSTLLVSGIAFTGIALVH